LYLIVLDHANRESQGVSVHIHSLSASDSKKLPVLLWNLYHAMGVVSIVLMHNVAIKRLLPCRRPARRCCATAQANCVKMYLLAADLGCTPPRLYPLICAETFAPFSTTPARFSRILARRSSMAFALAMIFFRFSRAALVISSTFWSYLVE